MPRHVFYSFHYDLDNWRASKIRNIGAIEGKRAAYDNSWETVRKKTDRAIEDWIDIEMHGRSCVVVLIGSQTAGRKWINHEIRKGWADGKGLVGINVHNVYDRLSRTTLKGANPFSNIDVSGIALDRIVKTYNPTGIDSSAVYRNIARNLDSWIDEAIAIRNRY